MKKKIKGESSILKLSIMSLICKSAICVPARSLNYQYRKEISLKIPKFDTNSTQLTSSYYIDYIKKFSTENPNLKYPFISIFTVMTDGVYIKKFKETWSELDIFEYNNLFLDTVINFKDDNQITAALSYENSSILVFANQDLKVKVVDLRNYEKDKEIKFLAEVDTSYGENEGDYRIESLWRIPYTNSFVFSSNRYEIIKFDFLTGKKEIFENFLGPIRFIKGPTETHFPEREPYNPNNDLSHIPDYIKKEQTQPLFLLTGMKNSMNCIMDWTNFKPVYFFDLKIYSSLIKTEDTVDYRIKSMAFYGYRPQNHFYYILTEGLSSTFVYSSVDKFVKQRISSEYKYDKITWLNGTSFIVLTGNFTYMKIYSPEDSFPFDVQDSKASRASFYNIVINMEMGVEIEDEWKAYKDLTLLWLILRNNGDQLTITKHFIPFEECYTSRENPLDVPRVYGRFRECQFCSENTYAVENYQLVYETNTTFIPCQRAEFLCNLNEVYLNGILFSDENKKEYQYDDSGNLLRGCSPWYKLEGQEKNFNYDDGCPPNQMKNYRGSCQSCLDNGCSNCELYSIVGCKTLNLLKYTKDKLDEEIYMKGYNTQNLNQEASFRKKDFKNDGLLIINIEDVIPVWRYQTRFPRTCYEREVIQGEQIYSYLLQAKSDYFLEKAEDTNYDISIQEEKEDPKDPLNTFVCVKNCNVGYYYDFVSLSCRRCSYGCAKCKKYGVCEECVAGLVMVEPTEEDRNLGIWGMRLENKCKRECNLGTYRKSFDGGCFKCNIGCKKCVDPLLSKTYKKANLKNSDEGFCIECEEKEPYLDLLSGKCVEICSGFGRFVKVNSETGKNECDFCEDENCEICDENDKSKCKQCKNGMKVEGESGKCVEDKIKIVTLAFIILGILSFFLIVGFILILQLRAKIDKKNKDEVKKKINKEYEIEREIPEELIVSCYLLN